MTLCICRQRELILDGDKTSSDYVMHVSFHSIAI